MQIIAIICWGIIPLRRNKENIKTVLDGIRAKLSSSQVEYVKGCSIRDTVTTDIEQAVAAAQRSEVIIAVGGRSQCP